MSPYAIIIIIFVVAGIGLSIWSWLKISKGRNSLSWPTTEGIVVQSEITNSLVPLICYHFVVQGVEYKKNIPFDSSMTAAPEVANNLIQQYPIDLKVNVYYRPDNPEDSTLNPGPSREDWIGLILGISALVFGIFLLIVGLA